MGTEMANRDILILKEEAARLREQLRACVSEKEKAERSAEIWQRHYRELRDVIPATVICSTITHALKVAKAEFDRLLVCEAALRDLVREMRGHFMRSPSERTTTDAVRQWADRLEASLQPVQKDKP